MSVLTGSLAPAAFRTSLRLEVACDFASVREATQAARSFMAGCGLSAADVDAWELALAEAANNAVEYAPESARRATIGVEILCNDFLVEARVTDHTPGFDWPRAAVLPDADQENGRGLFLIQALTEDAHYVRGPGRNVLILRKARKASTAPQPAAGEDMQRRLTDDEDTLTDMTEELASSYESLTALFRYSAELGAATDLRDFARRLVSDLVQITEADLAVLRLMSPDRARLETFLTVPELSDESPACPGIGTKCSGTECEAVRTRQDIWFDAGHPGSCQDPLRRVHGLRVAVCHAFYAGDQPIGTLTLARTASDRPFTAAQINLLHSFIDFLGIQIVNARLLDERTRARVTQRELEIAAAIQRSLLPSSLPVCPPFELAASSQSALQVGGDLYDVIPAGDGGVMLVIADVMGKGVPAALFAAILRSALRSQPQLFPRPGELLATLNRILWDDFSRVDMFATVELTFLDTRQQTLTTASAGHCPLLVCTPGHPARSVGDAGLPLGIVPEASYPESRMTLSGAACALLYTDGLTETRSPGGEMFGEKRLAEWMTDAAVSGESPARLKDRLLETLCVFRGTPSPADDQTFVVVRHMP